MNPSLKNSNSSPVIQSILDTDAYKLYMQQAIFHHYLDVYVVAEFHCRTLEDLRPYRSQIQSQINQMSALRLSQDEYDYLATLDIFQTDYLDYLRQYSFNPNQVEMSEGKVDGQDQLTIKITGSWLDAILWEVPLLAIISEIRNQHCYPSINVHNAIKHLAEKVTWFNQQTTPEEKQGFQLVDFGTRRRFSQEVQREVVHYLKENMPQFKGTSNYKFAQDFKLSPVGTQAHEWFQAHQQIAPNLKLSQKLALDAWLDEYPNKLGIALTDCINMDAFLRDFSLEYANQFIGLRHDSGDPITWGEKAIAHYLKLGIDPQTKVLVFSDGLSLDKALKIYRHFAGKIQMSFGIGTQLSCDIPSVKPLNIVIKITHCQGLPVAKISDEPGKIMCKDTNYLQALKQAFELEVA